MLAERTRTLGSVDITAVDPVCSSPVVTVVVVPTVWHDTVREVPASRPSIDTVAVPLGTVPGACASGGGADEHPARAAASKAPAMRIGVNLLKQAVIERSFASTRPAIARPHEQSSLISLYV